MFYCIIINSCCFTSMYGLTAFRNIWFPGRWDKFFLSQCPKVAMKMSHWFISFEGFIFYFFLFILCGIEVNLSHWGLDFFTLSRKKACIQISSTAWRKSQPLSFAVVRFIRIFWIYLRCVISFNPNIIW